MKISEVNIIFHDLIDHLYLHLSATEKLSFNLIEICGDIIPLFTERWLKRICHYRSLYLFKVYLLPFVTWLDHSILEQLVVASGSKNAVELLNLFDSKIDSYSNQSITSFPILSPSQLMIPLDDSEYTLLAMKFHPPSRGGATQGMIILQDILDMKLILKHNCKICSHGIQLVAMHRKLEIFYWIVPNDLVEIVEENLTHDRKFGIIMVAVKPAKFYSLEDNNRKPFSLLSCVWQDDTEVCRYVHT